jgi:hypothetical protein
MVSVPISDLKKKEIVAYPSVAWAKKPLSFRKQSFPKGQTPPHLEAYVFKKNSIPKACSEATKSFSGEKRIREMNLCISEKIKLDAERIPERIVNLRED